MNLPFCSAHLLHKMSSKHQMLIEWACFLHSGLSFLEKKVWPSKLSLHTWNGIKKENIPQFRWMNDTKCYSECQITPLHYAQIQSKNENYYLFSRDTLLDVILMVDVSTTFLSLSQRVHNWEHSWFQHLKKITHHEDWSFYFFFPHEILAGHTLAAVSLHQEHSCYFRNTTHSCTAFNACSEAANVKG